MKIPGNRLRSRWLRTAGSAATGVLAFAAATILSSSAKVADGLEPGVLVPVKRASVNSPQDAARARSLHAVDGAALAPRTADRFTGQVAHNPFGALNLKTEAPAVQDATPRPDVKSSSEATKKRNAEAAEPPAARPPPAPMAPALPFVAVGSITGAQVTNGRPVAFIKQQDQLLLLGVGDTIGQAYRVDSITAQRIEFTYLPLMQRQALPLAP